jgi:hypothetical protein
MGRLRGFGTTGAALFLWRELPTPELSMKEYKVGYKKPPKEHQFKPKHQTAARPNGGKRKENCPDVAGWLGKPLKVKRGGKSISMHPHEAAMISLGKRALTKGRAPRDEAVSQGMRDRGTAYSAATGADARRVRSTARC